MYRRGGVVVLVLVCTLLVLRIVKVIVDGGWV